MKEKKYKNYSLESLGKLIPLQEGSFHSYNGGFFGTIDSGSERDIGVFRYPCRINAFIGMQCLEGSVEIILNLKLYRVDKHCLFITTPNDIVQLSEWNGCKLIIIAFSNDFIKKTKIDNFNDVLSIFVGVQKHPCVRIAEAEAESLEQTFAALQNDLRAFEAKDFYNEIVVSHINLFIYKACSVISIYLRTQSVDPEEFNNREVKYYNKFMSLLSNHSKEERNLDFYASKLFITPKYMTTLIKKTSGKSAMEWINDFVVLEAKNLLKYSDMSIQEISEYLTFSNQSFFAQFFKRHTGVSPSQYRGRNHQVQAGIQG